MGRLKLDRLDAIQTWLTRRRVVGRLDHAPRSSNVEESVFSTARYIVDPFGCTICVQDNENLLRLLGD